ncbi:MAG: ATP-binding protein [bacterium]|nr:ATP-binding protein [bacterium]
MTNDSGESQSADEASTQYQELAALAGSLAHEIKNPLSVIRMNMDLLAEDLTNPDTPRERRALRKVEMVHKQCARLENLLNDFLRFVRLHKLDLKSGNLNNVLENVLDFYETQASETGVEIRRYLDADLPLIMLDDATLQASLMNLVKNALESMPDGGQFVARTRVTRNGVALDLIDTGAGMDDTTILHMFEAFYSTKDGGTGLGLPTARRVIESHGGRINVQSQVGAGTQFTLEFPTPPRIESSVE